MASNINYKKANTDLSQIVELFSTDITSSTIMYQAYHNGDGSTSDRGCNASHDSGWSGKQIAENKQEWNTQNITATDNGFKTKYKKASSTTYTFMPTKPSVTFAGSETNPLIGKYKMSGTDVSAAPIGCRPIGLQLMRMETAGTYYISRLNGITYWSTSSTIGSGSPLSSTYNPKYIIVEIQGGGGGGGGSTVTAGGQGGCGGAYIACALYIDESAPIQIVVGGGGSSGSSKSRGGDGVASTITATINGTRFTLTATGGHYGSPASGNNRSESDTPVDVSSAPANSDKFQLLSAMNGGASSGKDKNMGLRPGTTWNYPKSETQQIIRGPFRTGYTGSWDDDIGPVTTTKGCGGGGGPSMFHDGGYPIVGTAGQAGTWGGGGSGASYHFGNTHTGGAGGTGLCIVYY